MEPHTALLCDAHVWLLSDCPICALEREITAREMADRRIEELERGAENENRQIIELAEWFYKEVMPQSGSLVFQDYAKLNELGVRLREWKAREAK